MAQHAAALTNNTQIHPAMAQIPMLSAAGLNLTVCIHIHLTQHDIS